MEKNREEELEEYDIPKNHSKKSNLMRKLFEAGLCTFIICYGIASISFLLKVKIILMVAIGGPVLCINIIGIKNRSVTEFIIAFIKFKKKTKIYHLRSVKDERKSKIFKSSPIDFSQLENRSIAEQWYAKGKVYYQKRKINGQPLADFNGIKAKFIARFKK